MSASAQKTTGAGSKKSGSTASGSAAKLAKSDCLADKHSAAAVAAEQSKASKRVLSKKDTDDATADWLKQYASECSAYEVDGKIVLW